MLTSSIHNLNIHRTNKIDNTVDGSSFIMSKCSSLCSAYFLMAYNNLVVIISKMLYFCSNSFRVKVRIGYYNIENYSFNDFNFYIKK